MTDSESLIRHLRVVCEGVSKVVQTEVLTHPEYGQHPPMIWSLSLNKKKKGGSQLKTIIHLCFLTGDAKWTAVSSFCHHTFPTIMDHNSLQTMSWDNPCSSCPSIRYFVTPTTKAIQPTSTNCSHTYHWQKYRLYFFAHLGSTNFVLLLVFLFCCQLDTS